MATLDLLNETETDVAYTSEQRQVVERQLSRILQNAHFSHSKRFPSFLRFIVREELEGRGDRLKERTLGIEVFGRPPGYDTTSDPIVRVTAAEIRKRIAQFYDEAGAGQELRLSLPSGSYVPHFEWPADLSPALPAGLPAPKASASSPLVELLPVPQSDGQRPQPRTLLKPRHLLPLLLSVALLSLLCLGVALWRLSRPTLLTRFWTPIFADGNVTTMYYPQNAINTITLRDAGNPASQHHFDEQMPGITVDDLQPLVDLSGLLERGHQRYLLRPEAAATLTDLRVGPGIFIGAFDNEWTLRLTRGLRFRFGNDATMQQFWIEDVDHPERPRWLVDRKQQRATNNYRDFAIVARLRDQNTGQPTVIAAGIARGGTVAAGEFLTRSFALDTLRTQPPTNWDKLNMEFVLSTRIIDGRSAPPTIEAAYFW